jgi:hypothetical protein
MRLEPKKLFQNYIGEYQFLDTAIECQRHTLSPVIVSFNYTYTNVSINSTCKYVY